MSPDVHPFFDRDTFCVTYVVRDPDSASCAVIDPVLDFDPASGRTGTHAADLVIEYVRKEGLAVEWILETHVHADHLSGAPYVREVLGGRIGIGAHVTDVQRHFAPVFGAEPGFRADGSQFDRLFADGDIFEIGALAARVMHTPGHTPACLTYVIGDAAFVGDTLFMPNSGTARCDFPGGSARTLYRSNSARSRPAGRNAHLRLPRLRRWREARLCVGNHRRRGARRQHPRQGRHVGGGICAHARIARRDARPAAPDPAVDPGEHARRPPAARRSGRDGLSQDPGEPAIVSP